MAIYTGFSHEKMWIFRKRLPEGSWFFFLMFVRARRDNARRQGFTEIKQQIPWRIHGAAIYGNIYHQYTPNVSIYTSTMDPIWSYGNGKQTWFVWFIHGISRRKSFDLQAMARGCAEIPSQRSWLQVTYALYPRDVSWCNSCWKPIYNWGLTLYLLLLSLAANAVAKTVYVHFSVNCQTFLGEYIFLKKSAADMIRTHDCSARKISTCMCRKSYHGIHAVGCSRLVTSIPIPYSILHQIPGGCLLEMTPLLIYQPVGKPRLWFTVSLQHG